LEESRARRDSRNSRAKKTADRRGPKQIAELGGEQSRSELAELRRCQTEEVSQHS
jgi:hypothetical protein